MARFINQGFTLTSQVVGVTTDYTAAANEVLVVDTTSGSITVTLPDDPAIGDRVQFIDAAGQFGAYNCVVSVSDTNTYKIANLNDCLLYTSPSPRD